MLNVLLGNVAGGKRHRATSIVIEDTFGNPIIVVYELADGATFMTRVGDPHFEKTCRVLGVDKVVVVDHLDKPQPEELEGARRIL